MTSQSPYCLNISTGECHIDPNKPEWFQNHFCLSWGVAYNVPGQHFCPDWDYMWINEEMPEWEACLCQKKT